MRKVFLYKCKLILRNLTSVVHLKIKVEWYFLHNGFKYRESLQLHLKKCRHQSSTNVFRNFICQRENETAVFTTKKHLPRSEPRWIVTWEVLHFPSHFLLLETGNLTTHTHLWTISENPQQERSNSSNNAQATSDKGSRCQTLWRRWACWHWLTPTTQTAANSLVFFLSVCSFENEVVKTSSF